MVFWLLALLLIAIVVVVVVVWAFAVVVVWRATCGRVLLLLVVDYLVVAFVLWFVPSLLHSIGGGFVGWFS